MASPYTKETVNYARLNHLIYGLGTKAFHCTLDHYATLKATVPGSPKPSFNDVLQNHEEDLKKMKKKNIIIAGQWNQLYPPTGISVETTDLDITLCIILLKEHVIKSKGPQPDLTIDLCGLKTPVNGWGKKPAPTDKTIEGSLSLLKYMRNELLAHSTNSQLSDDEFRDYFDEAAEAIENISSQLHLVAPGIFSDQKAEITKYKNLQISPEAKEASKVITERWKIEDANVIQEIQTATDKVCKKIDEGMVSVMQVCSKLALKNEHQNGRKEVGLVEFVVLLLLAAISSFFQVWYVWIGGLFFLGYNKWLQFKLDQEAITRECEQLREENIQLRLHEASKFHNPENLNQSMTESITSNGIENGYLLDPQCTRKGSIVMTFYCLPFNNVPNIGDELPVLSKIMTEVCVTKEMMRIMGKDGNRLYACVTLLDIKTVRTSNSNISLLQDIFTNGTKTAQTHKHFWGELNELFRPIRELEMLSDTPSIDLQKRKQTNIDLTAIKQLPNWQQSDDLDFSYGEQSEETNLATEGAPEQDQPVDMEIQQPQLTMEGVVKPAISNLDERKDEELHLAEELYTLLGSILFELVNVISTSLSYEFKKLKVEIEKGTLERTQHFIMEKLRASRIYELSMKAIIILELSKIPSITEESFGDFLSLTSFTRDGCRYTQTGETCDEQIVMEKLWHQIEPNQGTDQTPADVQGANAAPCKKYVDNPAFEISQTDAATLLQKSIYYPDPDSDYPLSDLQTKNKSLVQKWGATTGLTRGKIIAVGFNFKYELKGKIVKCKNMIVTRNEGFLTEVTRESGLQSEGKPDYSKYEPDKGKLFSKKGDSGSAITTRPSLSPGGKDGTVEAIGMHLYGMVENGEKVSIAVPLYEIIQHLEYNS